MEINYKEILDEISANLEEGEEISLETIEELTNGRGDEEDE